VIEMMQLLQTGITLVRQSSSFSRKHGSLQICVCL